MKAPFWQAVKRHMDKAPYPFHMPGHKQGRGLHPEFSRDIAAADLTELPGLSNLAAPDGALAEAQGLAARYAGAAVCHFTTAGSSGGIAAAVLGLCPVGGNILLPRNAHMSFLHACILGGLNPSFYDPHVDSAAGLPLAADIDDFARKLTPEIDLAVAVSPSYHGFLSDVTAMTGICRERGTPLLVDEAHGTHLLAGPPLPPSAIHLGADAVVQSVHKTGLALTGSAWIMLRDEGLAARVKDCLRLVQTTSPSYPHLASLDLARAMMEARTEAQNETLLHLVGQAEAMFATYRPPLTVQRDPLRLVIDARAYGMTGYRLAELLAENGVQVEMADFSTAVLIISFADGEEALEALRRASDALPGVCPGSAAVSWPVPPDVGTQELTPRQAFFYPSREVALSQASGRIAAGAVSAYPPGVPLIWPGQRITQPIIEYIERTLLLGGSIVGLQAGNIQVTE